MNMAIWFHEFGGPEVLRWEDVDVSGPGPGEVRIRHEAVHHWPEASWPTQSCCRSSAVCGRLYGRVDGRPPGRHVEPHDE